MKVYSFSQARQQFASVLECAEQEGQVKITHRDGRAFVLMPVKTQHSPLDIRGIDLGVDRAELLQALHESRRV
ncbi:type II toxin-antitoxin system Phd/YefM family antitoxin [Ideonella sp.]|jgi:prevent-host-death family protein|uniref:type II toxin-antitoxin system Phd/YefM family antitoxin n=1 Tax=Ideonella sp. TaxID=1929293 RepID=UPI0037C0705E